MPKISVIIPIYNVEKYLSRCLDSVCSQTCKDIEIICVNDCSSDNSAEILQEYAEKDKRIKTINKTINQGQSVARTDGLKLASGEYIYFLDSDDWISANFLEIMLAAIINNKQDAVCCTNILSVTENGQSAKFIKRDCCEGFRPFHESVLMPWAWLLKRKFLDQFDVIFPEGLVYEDVYFFYVLIRSLETVYVTSEPIYYHFENSNSTMGKVSNRTIKKYDIIKNIELIFKKYKQENKLDTWSIPFFYFPHYMLRIHENKVQFYLKLRELFLIMKDDVLNNTSLYSNMELEFFNNVINYETYQDYKQVNQSLIASLKKNIMMNKKAGK